MKKESFENYITGYPGLTALEYMDILQKYRECFEKEVDIRTQEKVNLTVAQITMQLENKLRNEIRQEELIKSIAKISTELKTLRLLLEKAYFPTHRHGNVNIKKTANLPIFDCLWINIRKWQRDTGTSNTDLAKILGISERTLRDYDKSARTMSLEKLTNFLDSIGASIVIVYK